MVGKKKIMVIFGTRPEAIKLAPVIKELSGLSDFFHIVIAVTGQHREMLDQVLSLFDIKPDYDLKIMEESQGLSQIMVKSLEGLEEIFIREKPDMVLVQGDTATTFASSLAAFYNRIPIAHVEAGLRTGKKDSPFPEEMNRKLTGALADLHFAPTDLALENLENENVDRSRIYVTGNTVIDALYLVASRDFDLGSVGINLNGKKLILITAHRRENLGAPLRSICLAIQKIAEKYFEIATVIIPVHKNPIVEETVREMLGGTAGVKLIDPLPYEPFVHLMKSSYLILTDSGGIQEEAPSLGKPVLVMRRNTERPEAVIANTVKVVGTRTEDIVREVEKLLVDGEEYKKMSRSINPYGDGLASKRIVQALLHYFGFVDKRPLEFNIKNGLKR
ncbi:MAG: UDP-N-acetylglucosamine 2-epimerase (non-hydrolyzing) [Candidatus Saganbacteria bacterium]|nr:UDP-N-acetylglucosamine 2-epimerase (non-hydrolyzing) [Candidatus Saganbacteria bacterium]